MSDVDILFVLYLLCSVPLARFCGSKKIPTLANQLVLFLDSTIRHCECPNLVTTFDFQPDLVNQCFADVTTPHTCSLIMHTLVHILELLDRAD
jgi:hypothetical protein